MLIGSDNILGYRIKAARENRKWTQEQLAEMAGISTVYLSEIENKRTIPSFSILSKLCRLLNLSLDDLVFHTESDDARKISRLLSRCDKQQLHVIHAMIEAMLEAAEKTE